ncbi:MAG: trimethylamine methyltransferase family protein [Pseudoruegeria sp.]
MTETEQQVATQKPRRAGGRLRRKSDLTAIVDQLDWQLPTHSDSAIEPLAPEGVAAIHDAAMRILEEIGIRFLNPDAIDILRAAGCDISEENEEGALVKMQRDFVMCKIALAPSEFTITPRNPDHAIKIGGDNVVFGCVSSPPNCSDLERGRRPGDMESFCDLQKLSQYFNCIHFIGGYPVEPADVHASIRHLECFHNALTLTDKVLHAYALGAERVDDAMEMVRIAGGLSHAEFEEKPRMFTNINSTSPLIHDFPMLDGMIRLTRRGQATIVTPFTLAGAMSPITLAGTVAQSLAEALCAIVLIQIIRPGCACGIGTFSSNVDMKSGSPAFGTPEYIRTTQMTGQMARYYNLALRSSNTCVSNAPDNQSTWESANSLFAAMTSGTNMVYHAAGWIEGGLCASYEKFIIDCEHIQQLIRYTKPVSWDEGELALDAIAEVGQGGHFFGTKHTQERYRTAFYQPFLSDWSNYENWQDQGSVSTVDRALKTWKGILDNFTPPELPKDRLDALDAFIAKRKSEGGAPTDF